VLLYVMPLVCIVTPLLFRYFNIYLLGIAVNSWETAIFVMIVGFILIWIHNLIGNRLVRIIGMYTRSMFKAIKE
ncbi:histidine kinase, partial [Bacillus cereus]|nr:histidine kinase [Bacillus cereus]